MPRKLMTLKELKTVYGIPFSNTHLKRLEDAGEFPKRVRLGRWRVGWYADEIDAWMASRPRGSPAAFPRKKKFLGIVKPVHVPS